MATRMRHNPNQPMHKEVFVGPAAPEQKPELCSRCNKPIKSVYRVYERKFNPKAGKMEIVRGQYEVAHISITGGYIFTCEEPGLLDHYAQVIRDKIAAGETELMSSAAAGKVAVHLLKSGAGITSVECGARGNLYTTEDSGLATCVNCKARRPSVATTTMKTPVDLLEWASMDEIELANWQIDNEEEDDEEENDDMATKAPIVDAPTRGVPKVTAADIQRRIAEAQAKKANGTAKEGGAASLTKPHAAKPKPTGPASLTQFEEDAAMPKATVTRQMVKATTAAKKASTPGVLNLCGCGCGAAVPSRFQPGHDAKLHSWIKKLARGAMKLSELSPMVRDGMYHGAVQATVKDASGKEVLGAVDPVVGETQYLETLKGKGTA